VGSTGSLMRVLNLSMRTVGLQSVFAPSAADPGSIIQRSPVVWAAQSAHCNRIA